MEKSCSKCNRVLPLSSFHSQKAGKYGVSSKCIDCTNTDRKDVYQAKKDGTFVSRVRQPRLSPEERSQKKEEMRQYNKQYRLDNYDTLKIKKQVYRKLLKTEGIAAYGGKCSCCGETIEEFLTLEHLNGRDESDKGLTGFKMWMKAKSEGYPNTYTVLCFNCNCAKGAFGECPHQRLRDPVSNTDTDCSDTGHTEYRYRDQWSNVQEPTPAM